MFRKCVLLMTVLAVCGTALLIATPLASAAIITQYVGDPGEDLFTGETRLTKTGGKQGAAGDFVYGFINVRAVNTDGGGYRSLTGHDRVAFLFALEIKTVEDIYSGDELIFQTWKLGAVTPGSNYQLKMLAEDFGSSLASSDVMMALGTSKVGVSDPYNNYSALSGFSSSDWSFEFSADLAGADNFWQVRYSVDDDKITQFTAGLSEVDDVFNPADVFVPIHAQRGTPQDPRVEADIRAFKFTLNPDTSPDRDWRFFSTFSDKDNFGGTVGFNIVPEPGTLLVWCGLLGCAGLYRASKRRKARVAKAA